eukprot:TRINITY_DN3214_c0_g1_i1.p1 TRINITY_DN3214_c0_g1~~TRINITY_DN3214_c0_g1_i1.p1  ORF type:complete len:129 (+),score=16.91 TRINITY_DN3214_c0_g1_i1:28-387(+)
MDGTKRHVEIDGGDTIENIKYKVADITGIPYRLQKLIYEDKELKDNMKVSDIIETLTKSEFTVHLTVKAGILEKDIDNSPHRGSMITESGRYLTSNVIPGKKGPKKKYPKKRRKLCIIL